MNPQARPNILLILSDQHNKAVMGCAGDPVVRTPNLDRIAREGMRFDNVYTPSPLCVPARMSFLTARRPSRNQVWSNLHVLNPAIPTWAHALSIAGYETALIGRMHFEGPDQRHGFELRPYGEPTSRHFGEPYLDGPLFREVPARCSQYRRDAEAAGRGKGPYEMFDEQVTEVACQYLKERATAPGPRPFAAVVGYLLPHNPYVGNPALVDDYLRRLPEPRFSAADAAALPANMRAFLERYRLAPPLAPDRVRAARAAYYAMVESMDALIGRILAALDETGLSRDTLLVYTSDHGGDTLGEHGCWCKRTYYEGSAGVPFLARRPGVVPAGSRCGAVANLMDVGPTFVAAAGAEPMPRVDGRSLTPLLAGAAPPDWPDETFSELGCIAIDPPSRMIRRGPWKLWVFDDGLPPALFNLQQDPREEHDLAGDPGFRAVRDDLLARVREGWDPAWVRSRAAEQIADYTYLQKWGGAVNFRHPDTAPVPPGRQQFDPL